MKVVDIHAHVNFPQFDSDREEVIARAAAAGVGMINVGTDLASSRRAIDLAEVHDGLWATVGVHPTDCQGLTLPTWNEFEELARHRRTVAIGECGLDYFHIQDPTARERQKEVFARQTEIAVRIGKPLMIHCRPSAGAEDAYLDILTSNFYFSTSNPGNVHFFAGSLPTAKKFLDRGFTLSFTGVITFTNDYNEVVKYVPLDRLLAETDCPFVAPAPHRGRRNEPSYVVYVVKKIAALKKFDEDSVAAALLGNARRVFRLPD